MGKKRTHAKIILDHIGSSLYQLNQNRKNYRANKVLRVLMLRSDFIPFLEKLKNDAIVETIVKHPGGKSIKKRTEVYEVSYKLMDEYLDKVGRCKYLGDTSSSLDEYFYISCIGILNRSYIKPFIDSEDSTLFDDAINYPNIVGRIFDRAVLDGIIVNGLCSPETEKKYGRFLDDVVIDGSKLHKLPKSRNIRTTRPKACLIVIDDTTGKQELIDYINKKWDKIEAQLKFRRPERIEKRIAGSASFLRDVDIYNKYQEYKMDGFKNPDVKTWKWLKDESKYKIEIEPNTIRKIVSSLRSDIDLINSEK